MARTTVEDCLDKDTGHFDLAYKTGKLAHELIKNNHPKLAETTDKPVVVVLRDIAEQIRNPTP